MLRLPYEYSDPDRGPDRPHISVDVDSDHDGARLVLLSIEPHPHETLDDRDLDRSLTPDEARALAAALWHFADAVDR